MNEFLLTPSGHGPSLREVKAGSRGTNHGRILLVDSLTDLHWTSLLMLPRTHYRDGAINYRLGIAESTTCQGYWCDSGQYGLGNSSFKAFLSDDPRCCPLYICLSVLGSHFLWKGLSCCGMLSADTQYIQLQDGELLIEEVCSGPLSLVGRQNSLGRSWSGIHLSQC